MAHGRYRGSPLTTWLEEGLLCLGTHRRGKDRNAASNERAPVHPSDLRWRRCERPTTSSARLGMTELPQADCATRRSARHDEADKTDQHVSHE